MTVVGLDKLLGDCVKFEKNVAEMSSTVVHKAALLVKNSVLEESPKRLRGVGKKGAALGVHYDVTGGTHPVAVLKATGPWQFIERDTKPHQIPRANGKRGPVRPLFIGGAWVEGPVQHPGTKGKHPFEKGVNRALPLVETASRGEFVKTIRKSFG